MLKKRLKISVVSTQPLFLFVIDIIAHQLYESLLIKMKEMKKRKNFSETWTFNFIPRKEYFIDEHLDGANVADDFNVFRRKVDRKRSHWVFFHSLCNNACLAFRLLSLSINEELIGSYLVI